MWSLAAKLKTYLLLYQKILKCAKSFRTYLSVTRYLKIMHILYLTHRKFVDWNASNRQCSSASVNRAVPVPRGWARLRASNNNDDSEIVLRDIRGFYDIGASAFAELYYEKAPPMKLSFI